MLLPTKFESENDAVRFQVGDRRMVEADGAAGAAIDAGNGAHQRSLADAVAADDRDHRVFGHFQRDAAQDLLAGLVSVGDVLGSHCFIPSLLFRSLTWSRRRPGPRPRGG